MSAKPHGRIDPELEMQEHGDWFTDLVMWIVINWAALPWLAFRTVIYGLALAIILQHLFF